MGKPAGVAVDVAGNVYITDPYMNRIRKVRPDGTIAFVTGSIPGGGFTGDNGPAVNAALYWPVGIKTDAAGNVYFADYHNCCVRKISSVLSVSTIEENGGLKVYPNPTKGNITLCLNSALPEDADIVVTNMLGDKVRVLTCRTDAPIEIQLNQPPGIYLMSVFTSRGVVSKKVIVE